MVKHARPAFVLASAIVALAPFSIGVGLAPSADAAPMAVNAPHAAHAARAAATITRPDCSKKYSHSAYQLTTMTNWYYNQDYVKAGVSGAATWSYYGITQQLLGTGSGIRWVTIGTSTYRCHS